CFFFSSSRRHTMSYGDWSSDVCSSDLGRTFVPWFRYGMGWEHVYHGGSVGDGGSHQFRDGFDLVDARVGADFVAARGETGKTTRDRKSVVWGKREDRGGGRAEKERESE